MCLTLLDIYYMLRKETLLISNFLFLSGGGVTYCTNRLGPKRVL